MQLTVLTAVALLALGASAGEGVHLANCYQSSALGSIPFSQMLYYADDAQASQGFVPPAADRCSVTSPGQGGWKLWEGSSVSCTFPTNTYFTSDIQSGAAGYSVGQYAGSGQSTYHPWACFKDNNHHLYSDGPYTCWSVYYCLGV